MIIPACPPIGDVDLLLAVRTHPTHQPAQPMNDTWGDTSRLQEIGAKVVDVALTAYFFRCKPPIDAGQIKHNVEQTLSESGPLRQWVEGSGLQSLYVPRNMLEEFEELRKYFQTYVGAIWFMHGFSRAHNWIVALISGEDIKEEDAAVNLPPPNASSSQAQQQPPQYSPPAAPLGSPVASNLITLALINEISIKRGARLEWQAFSSGPPHMPLWEVCCLLDGVERGRAQGPNQKKAKEAAGRQAMSVMGWV